MTGMQVSLYISSLINNFIYIYIHISSVFRNYNWNRCATYHGIMLTHTFFLSLPYHDIWLRQSWGCRPFQMDFYHYAKSTYLKSTPYTRGWVWRSWIIKSLINLNYHEEQSCERKKLWWLKNVIKKYMGLNCDKTKT